MSGNVVSVLMSLLPDHNDSIILIVGLDAYCAHSSTLFVIVLYDWICLVTLG